MQYIWMFALLCTMMVVSTNGATCRYSCGSSTYYPAGTCSSSSACATTCNTNYVNCYTSGSVGCCGSSCATYGTSSSVGTCNCRCSQSFTTSAVSVGTTTTSPCSSSTCQSSCNLCQENLCTTCLFNF
jgi:hypothetical protein